ncbi:MAG: hypothetical protein FH751_12055 [Firmicutes bacterium]|nr:hypothetical protein [Bacillota bacterium]
MSGSYLRKFIILKSLANNTKKSPKGHTKLEIRDGKGKAYFNIEGIKDIKNTDTLFKAFFLSNKENVYAGSIKIKDNGKGSFEWRFNPSSIGETDLSIDDIKGVLIKSVSVDGKDNVDIKLAGYIDRDDGSLESMVERVDEKLRKEEPKKEEPKKEEPKKEEPKKEEPKKEEPKKEEPKKEEPKKEEPKKEEPKKEEPKKEEPKKKEPVKKEKIEEVKEEAQRDKLNDLRKKGKNYPEIEDKKDYFTKDGEKAYKRYQEFKNNQSENIDNYYGTEIKDDNYKNNAKKYCEQITNYALNILKYFNKVEPFERGPKGYTWWEIQYDRRNEYRGFLPFYNYIVNMYYPYMSMGRVTTCQRLMKKYRHYLFGMKKENDEVKYYVYAIPGIFKREEQPYRGMTGFTTWYEGNKNPGYWLLHIDPVSGQIMTPLKPTNPK